MTDPEEQATLDLVSELRRNRRLTQNQYKAGPAHHTISAMVADGVDALLSMNVLRMTEAAKKLQGNR